MYCNRIRVSDFRNIEFADVTFDEGVNILHGANAQGKTNLLEAIGFAAIGKSFRTSHDEDMVRFGAEMAEISIDFTDSVRKQNITVRMMKGKRKRIELNGVKVGRVSDIVGTFRTVLFCPENLSLIKDGPAERRNYLDVAISQLYPVYLKSLQRYNQILKERNQLIRNAEDDRRTFNDTVEFWSSQLAREAAVIASYRVRYLKRASECIRDCFFEMMGDREIPTAVYEGSSHREAEEYEDMAQTERIYYDLLMNNHEREIGAGSTLWGIHKDDIDIKLNGKSARMFASQGQQRSLALAMKLAEGEVCAQICGEKPVFLFDDVFSELDSSRRAYLSGKMTDRQVIMTTCEPYGSVGGKLIEVKSGVYTQKNG
ncbi:MAG: DNA replication/repair protein RecF [Clostridia bacterium]|nr:DNA replication/repair protein RecF [Clostridia bacterium]